MGSENPRRLRLGTSLVLLALALVANSAYLAAFGDPSLLYVANSLIHPALGVAVAILFAMFVSRHREDWAGSTGRATLFLLVLGAAFGGYLAVVGMTRPHTWALYAHVTLTIAGLFLLGTVFLFTGAYTKTLVVHIRRET